MGIPYELSNHEVVVASTSAYYPIPFPSRVELEKIIITSADVTTASIDFFSRQPIPASAITIASLTNSAGKLFVRTVIPFPCKTGDPVVIAGSSVVGYNTTHRVLKTNDIYHEITLTTEFAGNGSGGTINYNFSEAEIEHYRVLPTLELTGNKLSRISEDGVSFVNQDPRMMFRSTHVRNIYMKASVVGNYRVTLGTSKSVITV